eukprot:g3455.t1
MASESKSDSTDSASADDVRTTFSHEPSRENLKFYKALNCLQFEDRLEEISAKTLREIVDDVEDLPTYLNHNKHFKKYGNKTDQRFALSTILSYSISPYKNSIHTQNYDSSPLLFRLIPYLMKIYKYDEITKRTLMRCLGRYNNFTGYFERGEADNTLLVDEKRNTFLHRLILHEDSSFELVNEYLLTVVGKDSNKFLKMILQENMNGETPLQIAVKLGSNKAMWQMLEILKEEMDRMKDPPKYHQDEKWSSRTFQKAWVERLRLVHTATKYANVDLILQFIAMGCQFNVACEYRIPSGSNAGSTKNVSAFDLLFFPPKKKTEDDKCARMSILEYVMASPIFFPSCKYVDAPAFKYTEEEEENIYSDLEEKYKGMYKNRHDVLEACLGIKWKGNENELREFLIQLFQRHDAWDTLVERKNLPTHSTQNSLQNFANEFLGSKKNKIKSKFEPQFVEAFAKLSVAPNRGSTINDPDNEEFRMTLFTNHFIDTFIHEVYAVVKAVDKNLLRHSDSDTVLSKAESYLKPLPLMLGLGTRNAK